MRRTLLLLIALLATACTSPGPVPATDGETRTQASFEQWRATTSAPVAAFEAALREQGLDSQVPLHELLRTASDWSICKASPYDVPPEAQWPAAFSVLRLLRTLREQGVLNRVTVYSGFRNEELNRCAQGAPGSAHLRAYAIDFRPIDDEEAGHRLCAFWQTQGRDWKMGLSRYPSGRIHIDTFGWRTWGADHTGATAFCAAPPKTAG